MFSCLFYHLKICSILDQLIFLIDFDESYGLCLPAMLLTLETKHEFYNVILLVIAWIRLEILYCS